MAIVPIVAGVLGLGYGGFTRTKRSHEAKPGPIELSVKDRKRVSVPVRASVGAAAALALLLLSDGKRR